MKNTLYLILFLTLSFSCNRPERVTSPINPETPKALQEEKILDEIGSFSKRGKDDLLDELYSEQVSKQPELKQIETLIEKNKEEKVVAANNFESYNSKNLDYYNTANSHLLNISDSVLKARILKVINESFQNYEIKSGKIGVILRQIEKQELSVADCKTALKIIVTLPIIEKYQNDNLPNDSSYRRISKEQQRIIGKMEKILNAK